MDLYIRLTDGTDERISGAQGVTIDSTEKVLNIKTAQGKMRVLKREDIAEVVAHNIAA